MHTRSDITPRLPQPQVLEEALKGFGQQMRAHRRRLGLKQKDVADALGIAQSQCSRMETGRLDPTLMTVLRIQAMLDVPSLEDFFGHQPTRQLLSTSDEQMAVGDP